VTLNQYATFLNAVAKADPYALYNGNMGVNLNIAGIQRSGASGSYAYSVLGDGTRPVTYVSWFDAARFANWLHNGQPTAPEGITTTERGAYTLNGAMSGTGFTKQTGAKFWIPSESEWYKAAYYQPAAQGGDPDGYWFYATRSNAQPNSRNGSPSDPNSANYLYDDGIANGYNGGYAVTQSPVYSTTQNYLTGVGAFQAASSYYGTFDQTGNVWEWNDAVISGSWRGVRGGGWNSTVSSIDSASRPTTIQPISELNYLGFRLAAIPEPSALGLLTLGLLLKLWQRRRTW
jgi:formylglycine-generating enzyme required for sulfatase activity